MEDSIKEYSRRPGSEDSGREYELKITALLALRCALMQDTQDMWIGTNVDHVGDFDDIVLRRHTTEGKSFAYLMQLKHQENPKRITEHDFKYSADNRRKNKSKEDFSLDKYYKGFVNLKGIDIVKADALLFVLYTNKSVHDCAFLQNTHCDVEFLNTSSVKDCIYTFDHACFKYDPAFVQKLVLFTNQAHVSETDALIRAEIKKLAQGSAEDIANKFVAFIKGWIKGTNYLTKSDVIHTLISLLLEPYKLNFSKDVFTFHTGATSSIWDQIVSDKAATIVDNNDTILKFLKEYVGSVVRQYCGAKKMWGDHVNKNNKQRTMYDVYQFLCLTEKIPMLLIMNNAQNFHYVVNILKLCPGFRIIVIKSAEVTFKRKRGLKYFVNLNDLHEAHRDLILNQSVQLQGRACVKLTHLIDESMYENIKCDDIIRVLLGNFNIGHKCTPLSSCFIQRTLFNILLKPEVLEVNETFIIITKNSQVSKLKDLKKLNKNVFIMDEFDPQLLEKLKPRGRVHTLEYCDDWFQWVKSYGSTEKIRQYQFYDNTRDFSTVELISAGPGMGKTTLLDFVALQAPTDLWVLKVTLNSHNEYYENITLEDSKASDHLCYFNDYTDDVHLAQIVFRKLLQLKRILVLFDGFDEVPVVYKSTVMEITKSVHQEGFRMYLTTRPHLKAELEDAIGTIATTLRPFSTSDQETFLTIYFSKLQEHKLTSNFVQKLLAAARVNLNDKDCEFTGIPLQTRLLADVFQSDYQISLLECRVTLNTNFDLVYLYEAFINRKIDILSAKFGPDAKYYTQKYFAKHQQLFALKLLFSNDCLTDLNIDKQLKDYYENEAHMQLLQREGVVIFEAQGFSFVHRTFAEYLAAQWLCENLNNEALAVRKTVKVLIWKRFNDLNYKFLFRMFDCILAKNSGLHRALIHGKVNDAFEMIKIEPACLNTVDEAGRTIVHIAALHGVYHSSKLKNSFIDAMANFINQISCDSLIDIPDILEYNPLDYALASASLAVANELCTKSKKPAVNIAIDEFKLYNYFEHCTNLNYTYLFKILLPHVVCQNLLLKADDINENLSNYICKFGAADTTQLLEQIKIKVPGQRYYNDLCFASAFGTKTNVLNLLTSTDSYRYHHHYNPLHYAVIHERLEIAQILSKNATNPQDPQENTPLHLAVTKGYFKIVKHLAHTSNINTQNDDGNTPLMLAFQYDHKAIIKLLLAQNANINISNKDGNSCLHHAAEEGKDSYITDLITRGASINKQNNVGDTPLLLAFNHKNTSTAQLLISKNADINIKNKQEYTCLHFAAKTGQDEAVLDLIQNIDINTQNKKGETPLLLALQYGNISTAQLLLKNGADTNIDNIHGYSCLHYAAKLGHNDIVLEILQKGANINKQNSAGDSPLFLAFINTSISTAKLLIAHGANPFLRNTIIGVSPLHLLAKNGCYKMLSDLLATTTASTEINVKTKLNKTLLHYAIDDPIIYNNNFDDQLQTVQFLVNNGIHLDVQDQYGDTGLHLACKSSYYKNRPWLSEPEQVLAKNFYKNAATLLVSKGANILLKNIDGKTALDLAIDNKNTHVSFLIQQKLEEL